MNVKEMQYNEIDKRLNRLQKLVTKVNELLFDFYRTEDDITKKVSDSNEQPDEPVCKIKNMSVSGGLTICNNYKVINNPACEGCKYEVSKNKGTKLLKSSLPWGLCAR